MLRHVDASDAVPLPAPKPAPNKPGGPKNVQMAAVHGGDTPHGRNKDSDASQKHRKDPGAHPGAFAGNAHNAMGPHNRATLKPKPLGQLAVYLV